MTIFGTKLKALLAAGLIGTASLGMQSCAQPTDDGTYPPIELTDNKTPADDTKKGDNTAVEKYPVCKQLGIDNTLKEKMKDGFIKDTVITEDIRDKEHTNIIFTAPNATVTENFLDFLAKPAYLIYKDEGEPKTRQKYYILKSAITDQQLELLKTELNLQLKNQ